MKHLLVTLVFLLVSVLGYSFVEEYESLSKFIYTSADGCSYDNWQSHIVEGIASSGYNIYAPYDRQMSGFGQYVDPSDDQLAQWEEVILAFIDGNTTLVDSLITEYGIPYEMVIFHDTETGRTYHMLRELLNMDYYDDNATADTYDDITGSFDYGWGLYVRNLDAEYPGVIITIPHPNDDYITPALGTTAFQQWSAGYLMITGAGREVMWDDDGYGYTNSKSISDPTRWYNHPYNTAYRRFCDQIREDTEDHEFCVQLHSYDWNAHLGYNNCQIAAGNWNRDYPNLPIRDLSYDHNDMINATPYIVHEQDEIGIHDAVTIEEFYCVYYTSRGFDYIADGDTITVSSNIDLPGYLNNRQLQYSTSGTNRYDQREPFLHIEMDELPSCYPHTNNYWRWFNAYDPVTQKYNMGKVHKYALEFYQPLLTAIGSTLHDYFQLDDEEIPTAPAAPVTITSGYNSITLEWDRSSAYDFYSYQVLYSTEPIQNGGYQIFDRNNNWRLSGQAEPTTTVTGLTQNQTYYMAVRASDYSNNVSELSEELVTFTGPAMISNFATYGRSATVDISWLADIQSGNAGFIIDRTTDLNEPFETIASWETDTSLAGSTEEDVTYTFVDQDVVDRQTYYYRVSAEHNDGTIAHDNDYEGAQVQHIYTINVHNASGSIVDSVKFGKNAYATDGWDTHFDILNSDTPSGNYIECEFYEQYYSANYRKLYQEIQADYDENTWLNTWPLRIRTNQLNQDITIELADSLRRNGEKLYLRNSSSGLYTNLADATAHFTATSSDWLYFTLYWGDLQPGIDFNNITNQYFQAGDEVNLTWDTDYPIVVDHIRLFCRSGADSLLIANSLGSTAETYSWEVPNDVWMTDCTLYARAFFADGSYTDYESKYRFGIVPNSLELGIPEGWKLSANPVTNAALSPGDNTELYSWDSQDGFELFSHYEYGVPFWTHGIEYWGSYLGGINFRPDTWEAPLQQGWNFVPNPHYGPLNYTDITIQVNDFDYTFTEAVRNGYVSKSIYVYRNGYRLVQQIEPEESFFIFCFIPNLDIEISPFPHHPLFDSFRDEWTLELIASQDDDNKDLIVMGANEFTTVDFDPFFDTPEPPEKPEAIALNLQIVKDPGFSIYQDQNFYQEFKRPFTYEDVDVQTWNFQMQLDVLSQVTLRLNTRNFLDDHSVLINIGDYFFNMTDVDSVSFFPNQLQMNGTVRIYNQYMNADNGAVEYRQVFTSYPNPFNPETTFRYSLPKRAKVELCIYNIRGQRVDRLVSEVKPAGVHETVWKGRDSNGKQVSSGVYFSRLSIDGKPVKTRKILLLK